MHKDGLEYRKEGKDRMTKFSVKRPFFVFVAVTMLLVLGVVSFTKMSTDLLPEMNLPYMMIITTYPGAAPERVESNITEVIENGVATVNGVENVISSSSENYSMIMLEFAEDTNMDSAMVKVSTALNQLSLPETAGTPILMEISADMMSTYQVAIDYEGKDSYELTQFVEDTVIPEFERQAGVASVDVTGMIEQSVEVRLDQDKIDEVNESILEKTDKKLAKAKKKLDKAEDKLAKAKKKVTSGKDKLEGEQEDKSKELGEYSKMLDEAMATKAAYASQLASLKASRMALKTEKAAYKENNVIESYHQMEGMIASMREALQSDAGYAGIYNAVYSQVLVAAVQSAADSAGMNLEVTAENAQSILEMFGGAKDGITASVREQAESIAKEQVDALLAALPVDVKDAIEHEDKLNALKNMLEEQGMGEAAENLTKKNLETLYHIVNVRIPQIDTALANLKTEIAAAEMVVEQVNASIKEAEDSYTQVEAGKITAAAAFGAYTAQMSSTEATLTSSEAELKEARKSFKDARKTALENANLDSLLTMETLSGILTAENFSMPAGYINDDRTQYLLKVGDAYNTMDEFKDTLLCRMKGIGEVRLSDVAVITMIDNADDSYAKMNDNEAIMLSVKKSSTAGTSTVSKACNKTAGALEKEYDGLRFTSLLDQGEYIDMIVDSVLSNLVFGALLAILVLLIFLRDVKPTAIVAFSIPLSVLFAIVLMYFSGITLNMISLSGLALGIGMLVDNSIVVIENIYRLRSEGVSVARAAVQGAKQVAGAIFASTLTTICVFLPIVFTDGITRSIMQDMCLTIAYSLSASLIVALTVVPCMGSRMLKKENTIRHRLLDAMIAIYEKMIRFCLRFKAVPILAAVALLVFCIWRVTVMGIVMMPEMGSEQMTISVTAPDETTTEEDYELADTIMERVQAIDGVDTVGAMMGGAQAMIMSASTGPSKDFSYFIILEEEAASRNSEIADEIEEKLADLDCEFTVSESNMDMSSMLASGLEIDIYGKNLDTLVTVSEDVMGMVSSVEGFEEVENGQEAGDKEVVVSVDKDKAMKYGLTVAQVYGELAEGVTTEKSSTTLTFGDNDYDVSIVDESNELTMDNLLKREFETTTTDAEGNAKTEKHKLKEFATVSEKDGMVTIARENQVNYIAVTATTMEGYNTTLLSRDLQKLLDDYDVPDGYTVEIAGETESTNEMMEQMLMMIGLAIIFIYLVMVAQFQSLLSPFIVIFTIPLAFTGGLIGLLLTGEQLSMMSMMGFLVLSGVVVNNGIVFVDYTNQLRYGGMSKKEALVDTGKTRMRPILMTALTTILAMSTMVFSKDTAAEMSRGMAIVTIGGLAYATVMTLFIVPVLYDIFYRKAELKEIDLGDEETL